MQIAHISDLHISLPAGAGLTRPDALSRARALIADLNASGADLVVITGDNVNDAKPEEYALLREALSGLRLPFVILPGNHDDRALLRESFPDQPWADPVFACQERHFPGLRLFALDTLHQGHIGGRIEPAQLGWFDSRLAAPFDGTTLIALHHPPLPPRMGLVDRNVLGEGAAKLAQVLARLPGPVIVMCGHMHRAFNIYQGNMCISCISSTAAQFALCVDGAEDATPVDEPFHYALHLIGPGAPHIIHNRYPSL